MSQTPRKFSEKIAILERKSKVEADDFMAVMSDVKKITATGGHSQHTTPSSTPYPCSPGGPGSSSAIQTPSAIESPIDSNNLHVMQQLAGMPWQWSGGSLPNVHQMVQKKPGMPPQMGAPGDQYHPNWLYWQTMQTQTGASPGAAHRTRSPGSSVHYHPYRSSSGNVAGAVAGYQRNERIPPLESHMMTNNVHLQLPDPSWSTNRARSDPAIHMNTMNTHYYNPQPNAQFSQQQQQQQWPVAQMQQNGAMPHQQSQYYMTNGGGQPQTCTTSTGAAPLTSNSQPGSTASSASSVPMTMNSPQHQVLNQQQPMQYTGGYFKQSPCGSPDMTVGSLPNMHSTSMQNKQQNQFKVDPGQSNYCDYEYDIQQQQSLQSVSTTMQQYCNGGSIYAHGAQPPPQMPPPNYIQPKHQLTMPQGMGESSSQSAPTSPAQMYTNNPLQPQWTPTRHYSASPDNMGIPRVTLTRVEGNTECFQEFQDLCLNNVDNDLQQALIQGGEDNFDPVAETQLINSTR